MSHPTPCRPIENNYPAVARLLMATRSRIGIPGDGGRYARRLKRISTRCTESSLAGATSILNALLLCTCESLSPAMTVPGRQVRCTAYSPDPRRLNIRTLADTHFRGGFDKYVALKQSAVARKGQLWHSRCKHVSSFPHYPMCVGYRANVADNY